MAKVESLGVHTPVALPYLIREGILPQEARRDLYQWETYVFEDANGDVEEEVLTTKHCVVWSQGKYVRNVYRFELEGEDVAQALLTTFPDASTKQQHDSSERDSAVDGYNKNQARPRQSLGRPPAKAIQSASKGSSALHGTSSRALAVFLKTKAHVYFLHGSSHIVDLPFGIECAFPAPRGCIVQKKAAHAPAPPPTPQIPAAPPNSFFSSQLHPTSSYLQSPTLARSFRGSQPVRPSPLGDGNAKLDTVFQDAFGSPSKGVDEEPTSLYSLTSPLSDFGVLTYSLQHPRPRLSSKAHPGLAVEFETLDAAEQIVYVSCKDELGRNDQDGSGAVMLIVTANTDLRSLTVWHAWYIEEKSLRDLLKQRAAQKAAKVRRRSSFLSANIGTGATTPAVRREGARDSLAAGALRVPSEAVTAQPSAPSSRKPTRKEEEEAMASRMDPDYQPTASQQPNRDSRRISSLNTDLRASQTAVNLSFIGPGGRRNASFGGPNDRRSFGHRKSRGSTPGSVYSRSLGPDDDIMDLDSNGDFDGEESVESVVRHMRATFEAAGADSVFGSADEGFKRELVVRKLHSFPLGNKVAQGAVACNHRVAVLNDPRPSRENDDHRLCVYIHDRVTKNLFSLKLLARQRALWPEIKQSIKVGIPTVTMEHTMGKVSDILKLKDGRMEAVLLNGAGLILSTEASELCALPSPAPYRVYSPLDVSLTHGALDEDVGKNRVLQLSESPLKLAHGGGGGSFDEVDADNVCHRRRLQLRPEDPHIDVLLDVCELLLPPQQAAQIRPVWCMAYAWLRQPPERSAGSGSSPEIIALVTAMLHPVIKLLDAKARAALNVSKLSAGKHKPIESNAFKLQKQQRQYQLHARKTWSWMQTSPPVSRHLSPVSPNTRSQLDRRKDQLLPIAIGLAEDLPPQIAPTTASASAIQHAVRLMLGLHMFREEQKLCTLSAGQNYNLEIGCVIAQIGTLLGLDAWSFGRGTYYALEGADEEQWAFVSSKPPLSPQLPLMDEPIGVYQWFEHALEQHSAEGFPSLAVVAGLDAKAPLSPVFNAAAKKLTPRLCALSDMLAQTAGLSSEPTTTVELMANHGLNVDMLETLPEAVAAPLREAIARCEREPPTSWPIKLLQLVGREELEMGDTGKMQDRPSTNLSHHIRDVQSVCHALDHAYHPAKTREASRRAVSQLIFNEDRRLVEAIMLVHYQQPHPQVGECPKQLDWSDAQHYEQQRRVMLYVALRMLSLPAGDGMIHFRCETPLLTEKYPVAGFSSNCLMQPMGQILTIDRSGMSEDKYGWAYFHAGVSAGLRISQNVKGIDTSWIAFNKPTELTNRHAGLLLALGLGGHLRLLAKWLSFKYLTPKHTMTSVGLLLGLSASYLGTMDGLITRMLSVHITRMLPAGAAELNVSPITQTAGLMGIGLLYYGTQHRRMSEIMLSEIEYMEAEDPDSGPDPLRDESYRLAAGFALGFINLGKGKSLRGLHGMYLPERLLAMAVGSRPIHAVHVFDRACAGAIMAIAMVYMKSGDQVIARKIDIPDTEAQFDHVRPDMLMLRAMARHVIVWDDIVASGVMQTGDRGWIHASLPACYKSKLEAMCAAHGKYPFTTADVPFYNIATGLAWALGLKYAGSGDTAARGEILYLLEQFNMAGGESYYYDGKLARTTVRRCIDVLALSAAMVMAGTGDLRTFRHLRRLHGRTDAETPYGSHLAAHMAMGVLFMGGGTYTLSTSDFAIASLMCAFYPLFPMDVHDNRVHLQAFRHLWVFAAEARCLVVEDIDTHRPIKMPTRVTMKDRSTKSLTAPCLLPELDTVSTVHTDDPSYWRVTLDFAGNSAHLSAFRRNQNIYVRRCPTSEAHNTAFSATLAALNDAQSSQLGVGMLQTISNLSAFRELDKADLELILPPDAHSSMHTDERGTVVDDRLALVKGTSSSDRDTLWNLRILFAWAERARNDGQGKLRWIGNEVVEALKAKIDERSRSTGGADE